MSSLRQTVDQTVGSVMAQLQLDSGKKFLIRGHIIDFLVHHRHHVKAIIKMFQLGTVPQSLTIPFPRDYLGFSKIGWVINGQVHLVAQNKNLAKSLTYNQQGLFQGAPVMGNLGPLPQVGVGVPQNAIYNQRLLGTGTITGAIIPELDGYFREDWENRVIRISPNLTMPSFYMEYASDCFEATDDYIIHPYAYLCAKRWAIYYYYESAYNISENRIQRAANELDVATREMRRLFNNMTAFDYLTAYDKVFGYGD